MPNKTQCTGRLVAGLDFARLGGSNVVAYLAINPSCSAICPDPCQGTAAASPMRRCTPTYGGMYGPYPAKEVPIQWQLTLRPECPCSCDEPFLTDQMRKRRQQRCGYHRRDRMGVEPISPLPPAAPVEAWRCPCGLKR